MPASQDPARRARPVLRGPLSAFAVLSSLLLLATCDLDKITAAKQTGSGTTLSFNITGGQDVILAGTTALSVSPKPPGTVARWSSSQPAIATVDTGGVVTGLAIGTATITARLLGLELDTGVVQSRDITVKYKGIRVSPLDSITGFGLTRAISVVGLNANDQPQAGSLTSEAAFVIHDSGSTNATIASLSGTSVKALKNGTAYLKATYDAASTPVDSVKIRVRQVAKRITFPDTVFVVNAMNFDRQVPYTARDIADSVIAQGPTAVTHPRFRASDTSVVTLDSISGVFRFKKRDTVRVFVKVDTVTRSQKVKLVQLVGKMTKDSGDAQVDTVGRLLPVGLKVVALDSGNTPVPGATVTFHVASGGGTITDSVKTTDAAGAARLGTWRLGFTAGSQSVTASVGTITATFTATARPLGPAKLAFRSQPTAVQVGMAIAPSVTVAIEDSLGNVVATSQDSVFISFANNPTGATLSGALRAKAVNGIATFDNVSVNLAGSAYTLQATSGTLTNAISNAFDVYGAPAKLAFLTHPGNTTTGGTISPADPVRVAIQDAGGNTVTSSTANVTVAINDCGTCPAPGTGTLSGTLTVAAVAGIATFGNLSISGVGSGYKLQATSGTLSLAVSNAFNINPVGTPTKVAFLQEPTNAVAGASVSPAITVAIQDANGGTVTTSTATVNLTIASNANPGGSALSGGTQVSANAVNGIATFSTVSLNKVGVGYKLVAASTGLTNDTSATFNINAGAESKLGFLQHPTHTIVNQTMSPAVRVAVQDANGNTVTSAGARQITLALAGTGCTATPAGNTATTANGVATFSSISFTSTFTNCTLAASTPSLTSGTSTAFNSVGLTGPVKLGFITSPTTTTAGSSFGTLQVAIQDVNGNTVTSASASITIGIGNNPTNATLFGGSSQTQFTSNGVATFTGQNIRAAAQGYTLIANATGYQQATTAAFDITAGAVDHLRIVQQPTSRDAGVPFDPPISVAVVDQYDNTVPTASNAITVALDYRGQDFTPWWEGAVNTQSFQTSAISAANGVATFPNLRLKGARTGLQVYACSPSCSGGATLFTNQSSNSFDIRVGPPSALTFNLSTGNEFTAGQAYSFNVTASDSVGNQIGDMNSPVTVSLTGGDPAAVLSGTKTVTAVNGVAAFTGMSIDKAADGYRMNASASGYTTTQSAAFRIVPSSPTKLGWIRQPQNTFQNAPLNPSGNLPQVAVQDQFGNTVTNFCCSVAIRIGTAPGGVQLKYGGNTTTDAFIPYNNGVATLPSDLVLTGTAAEVTLIAAHDGALTSATSAGFRLDAHSTKTKLGFVSAPPNSNGYAVNITPAVQVAVQDAYGNTVLTATDDVTLALSANPGTATLRGGGARTAAAGVATFDALSLDRTASGYTLTASATGLTSVTTGLFSVTSPGVVRSNVFNLQDMVLSGDELFWVDNNSSGNLQKVSAYGGSTTPMAVTSGASKITADAANVYWADIGDGTNGAIKRVRKSDKGVLQLTAAADVPSFTGSGFAVDEAYVYYIARRDAGGGQAIRRVPIGAGASTQLFDVGFFSTPYFHVDTATDRIYFFDPAKNAIRRMSTAGTDTVTLAAAQNAFWFAVSGTTLYFADFSNNIRSVSTETRAGVITPYFQETNFIQGFAINGTSLYVNVSGNVRRYALGNITSTSGVLVTNNAHMQARPQFDGSSLYYSTGGSLEKVVK